MKITKFTNSQHSQGFSGSTKFTEVQIPNSEGFHEFRDSQDSEENPLIPYFFHGDVWSGTIAEAEACRSL